MENIQPAAKLYGPKDVFLELWVVGTLYLSSVLIITLLFQYVNYFFVDAANPYSFSQSSVRWMVAVLIAILPTHIFALCLREKEYVVKPQKREGRLRKWLLYLTLFFAAIACVVDFSVLIYNLLGGELSTRFLLKVLAVAIVAGGLFWYYLKDLKREKPELPMSAKVARWTALAVIVIVIIGAFFISGSPFRARLEKLDQQRVYDLQNIQSQIIYFWQKKSVLPASLTDLDDPLANYAVPLDPENKTAYEYRATGKLSFELCTTFSAAAPINQGGYETAILDRTSSDNWQHKTGRTCFTRTIDPELYKSTNQIPAKPNMLP